jgi:hypothetical protein
MKEGNPNRKERTIIMKKLQKVERKRVAAKSAQNHKSNAQYVKRATAALDAWETIRADRENE